MGFSKAENETYVANFAAAHKDSADTVTADTLGCTGANLLTLATNSALSFTSTPDFKNPLVCASGDANAYEFTVTATSGSVNRDPAPCHPHRSAYVLSPGADSEDEDHSDTADATLKT